MTPNYRKRIEFVQATQLTQELIEAALFDGAPMPTGARIVSADYHPGRRVVHRVRIFVGKESVDIGDWVTTDANGHTTYWAPDIFERVFEPLATIGEVTA